MEFRDVELVALRDVYLSKLRRPGVSKDYNLRRIFREYSKLFHTPLHVVHELPIEFVIQAWLEEHYETYTMEDLRAEVAEHTRTHADLVLARLAEDEADAETFLIMQEDAQAMKAVRKLEETVRGMQKAIGTFRPKDRDTELASDRTKPKEIPQGITMRWEDVDLDQDSFGILDSPKSGK